MRGGGCQLRNCRFHKLKSVALIRHQAGSFLWVCRKSDPPFLKMPTFPSNRCGQYHCKASAAKGSRFCLSHGTIKPTTRRHTMYRSAAWDSIRTRQLSISPLCQSCLLDSRVTQAFHVDHVFPWGQISPNAFLKNLFQSLCAECHGIKTGHERKGTFYHYAPEGLVQYTITDYNEAIHAQTT